VVSPAALCTENFHNSAFDALLHRVAAAGLPRVQLNVAYSMGHLDALWVERALLRTLAFLPKLTKRARERAFHHSVRES
jgi:hypothetical protein